MKAGKFMRIANSLKAFTMQGILTFIVTSILSVNAQSQAQFLSDSMKNKLQCHYSGTQKVFLHLNKNLFISGEDVMFKAYLVTGPEFKPDSLCKVLYVVLKNSNNQKIKGFRINLTRGTGHGSFSLPDTLTTGYYSVMAFTNNMRNFSHDLYFAARIFVGNQGDDKLDRMVTDKNPGDDTSGIGSLSDQSTKYTINNLQKIYNGFLVGIVADIESKDVETYHLICYSGSAKISDIPFRFSRDSASVRVNDDLLGDGMNHLCLLNSSAKLLCERLIYKPPSQSYIVLDMKPDTYGTRQKVRINVTIPHTKRLRGKINMSANVSQISPVSTPADQICNINNYFPFFSELGSSQVDLLSGDSLNRLIIREKLLPVNPLYHSWKNIFQSGTPVCHLMAETNGYIITGKLVSDKNLPMTNTCVYLSAQDSIVNLKYCYTDSDGNFMFRLGPFYDNKNLVFQVNGRHGEDIRIEPEDKFNDEPLKQSFFSEIPPDLQNHISQSRMISLVNKVYKSLYLKPLPDMQTVQTRKNYSFYGLPDERIFMSDYSELADFNEIVRNILPGISYSANTHRLRVIDLASEVLWKEDALLFLNNVPFPDPVFISKLSSRQIHKIEVKKNHLRYGDLDIYGIVSISTNQKNIIALDTKQTSLVLPNTVNDTPVIAGGPDYSENAASTIPDFRQTLYWNPDVELTNGQATLEFYTSDIKGTFTVEIEGITSEGQPFSCQSFIEVK